MINIKNIAKSFPILLTILPLLAIFSCTEDIVLEPATEKIVPVLEGNFSSEYTRHEIVLRYSSELYSHERQMISGAEIYITGGGDTIWYHESPTRPGHYLTDSVAGKKQRWYHLEVRIVDNILSDRPIRMYADSYLSKNIDQIDSVGLLPLRNAQGIPFVDDAAAVCVCPYFQALSDPEIVYSVELYLNGNRFNNRPSRLVDLFAMEGYAGYYFNGPEMLNNNIEIPVGIMKKSYLKEGDVVKVKLVSITKDYMYFLFSQKLAIGVNPIMGAFPANFSNLNSNCGAIGWFSTTSVASGEGVYHEW